MTKLQLKHLLQSDAWFSQLPINLQDFLVNEGQVIAFGEQQAIFYRDDEPNGFYAILSGSVNILGLDQFGNQAMLALLTSISWFGEISLIDAAPRTHDAITLEQTQLFFIKQQKITSFLALNPTCWRYFAKLMSHKLRMMFVAYEDLRLLSAKKRIIKQLCLLAENYTFSEQPNLTFSLNQSHLSALAATSRQTCNQVLNELVADDILKLSTLKIEIINLTKLKLQLMIEQ
ncbi:Crp/Fnr family transcriptional regulator [Pseudoalteromonas tunicata]|uniref:Crp/Fnr family transcriptional regulator n=1 Tax=Pseudoalteromonas tunicata TaxID=314281 RepID=UPI00273D7950|nr:Crp/Fnr family transcriptional regulator [Pseudoalteromonas tunicata]MDP4984183.1 Crp/Fnr family transcriptional regulator [Pseudoalteromonas tunicata]